MGPEGAFCLPFEGDGLVPLMNDENSYNEEFGVPGRMSLSKCFTSHLRGQ